MGKETGSTLRRSAKLASVVLIVGVLGLYGSALVSQDLSVRRAKRLLDQMDRLRIGDSTEEAEDALSFCGPKKFDNGLGCQIVSGPFNHPTFWLAASKVLGSSVDALLHDLQWIGIRGWLVDASVLIKYGKISQLSVDIEVEGRYDVLMARCIHQSELLSQPKDGRWVPEEERRTLIRWWGSTPLGETLVVVLTPRSTEKELRAGEINRGCLSGFGGCRGLCELLPGTTPVLDDREEGYGGCVGGVPEAKCRPKAGPICR